MDYYYDNFVEFCVHFCFVCLTALSVALDVEKHHLTFSFVVRIGRKLHELGMTGG